MRKINHGYEIGSNPLVEAWSRNASAAYQIGFNSMSYRLMCQHSAHHAAENDRFVSGFGIHALFLVHQFLVKLIYFGIDLIKLGEIVIETSEPAESLEQFNRNTFLGFRVQYDIQIAAGCYKVAVKSIGSIYDPVLRIFVVNDRPAGQIRIFRCDIVIYGLAHFDEQLLLCILNIAVERDLTGSDRCRKRYIPARMFP